MSDSKYFYFDSDGNKCSVDSDHVSEDGDGKYYDDDGHECHPQLDGIVEGTAGNDLIDYSYTGDPQGDMIDHNDAIFGNVGSNDDIVYGYGGNDTILSGAGNDTVYGGSGNDYIDGGSGTDSLMGGSGSDTLTGGATGDDSLYGGADKDVFVGLHAGEFVDGGEGGCDYDTLDLTGSGPFKIIYDPHNHENGTVQFLDPTDHSVTGTLTFTNIETVVPCFTPGAMIATPRGEVAVEDLAAGEEIITRDDGVQKICWVGRRDLDWGELATNRHLKPILIPAGSLGEGLPLRDMLVSPNHRMLVANDRTQLYFEEHEVLVAAKHLVGLGGIRQIERAGISYLHFLCERHEVVLVDGAWTESFQPGDHSLKGMGNAQRSEIFELFPQLRTEQGRTGYLSARRTLRGHEARLFAR